MRFRRGGSVALAAKPSGGWVLAMDRTNWQLGRTHINILVVSVILDRTAPTGVLAADEHPVLVVELDGADAFSVRCCWPCTRSWKLTTKAVLPEGDLDDWRLFSQPL